MLLTIILRNLVSFFFPSSSKTTMFEWSIDTLRIHCKLVPVCVVTNHVTRVQSYQMVLIGISIADQDHVILHSEDNCLGSNPCRGSATR